MGCIDEQNSRKTYANQLRLAKFKAKMVDEIIVIYRDEKGFYDSCPLSMWSDEKGVRVQDVANDR